MQVLLQYELPTFLITLIGGQVPLKFAMIWIWGQVVFCPHYTLGQTVMHNKGNGLYAAVLFSDSNPLFMT